MYTRICTSLSVLYLKTAVLWLLTSYPFLEDVEKIIVHSSSNITNNIWVNEPHCKRHLLQQFLLFISHQVITCATKWYLTDVYKWKALKSTKKMKCVWVCVHVHTCLCVCACTYVYVCLCVCIHYAYVCMCLCVHACMHTHIYVYIHNSMHGEIYTI